MKMQKVKFCDCVDIVGKAPKNFSGEKIYVSTGALDKNYIDFSQIEKINFASRPSRANLEVKADNIIFAKMYQTDKTLLIDEEKENYIYSTGFFAIRPKQQKITTKCLMYLIQSDEFIKQKDKYCSGATQKAITNEGLKKIEINIPPIEEQKVIAERLDKVSELIEKRKEQIKKLDLLIKSRFLEMFGDSDNKINSFPKVRLGDYAQLQGGYAFKSKDFVISGIPIVQIGNVNRDNLEWEEVNYVPTNFLEKYANYVLFENDLLLAMTRPIIKSIDSVKIVKVSASDTPCMLNQRVGRFLIKKELTAVYLETVCKTDKFKKHVEKMSGNSLQPNISSKQVEDFIINLPPIELQNQFAEFVEQVDKLKKSVKTHLEKLETLKKSLMQQYFG